MEYPNNCKLINNFTGKDLFKDLISEINFEKVYRYDTECPSLMANQCDLNAGIYPIYRYPLDKEPTISKWTFPSWYSLIKQ